MVNDLRGTLTTLRSRGVNWPIMDYNTRPLDGIRGVTLHYTEGPAGQSAEDVAVFQTSAEARGNTGVDQPFPAIAYTFLVTEDGVAHLCHGLETRVWHSSA